MKLTFKDINPGIYPAKITNIKQEYGPYGLFLRLNFTVTQGELKDWSFYGIVKPNPFKQSKFYRWLITILGNEPAEDFSVFEIIGKECSISLERKVKGNKVYYSVTDLVEMKAGKVETNIDYEA